jgi:hypothetical protein
MAKSSEKKLYSRMRANGIRKKVARDLSELSTHSKNGKRAPKPLRETVDRLEDTVSELRDHVRRGERKTAGRKAARTRQAKARKRSGSARKGARARTKA